VLRSNNMHGTGMGIWLPNDERIRACRIGREVRKKPFAGEALLAWEVTHHIMTSAHEWIGFGERCARTAFCMATACQCLHGGHHTPRHAWRVCFRFQGADPLEAGGGFARLRPPSMSNLIPTLFFNPCLGLGHVWLPLECLTDVP
jgi:hypothetical protein